jgi:thiol-disulfide isomerase/thioredoxin
MRPLLAACLAAPIVLASTPVPRVAGVGRPGGGADWSQALPSGAPGKAPLLARRWAPTLPPLTIRLLGGGTFRTADQRGKVLLLDVWATWCEPCKIELPHLQALVEAESARGLVAVAINAQEPEEVAARGAAAFGIKVPVGLYDETLDEALAVRSLPAVLLVDRQGQVRARWDGYRSGLEQEIAARARALLDEVQGGAGERVGEVVSGAGTLTPRYWRDLPVSCAGVAAVGTRLILHGGSVLWGLERDGTMTGGPATPTVGGRLLAADLEGDGHPELLGWQRARTEILVADLAGGAPASWHAPGPVLDLAVLPGGRIVLATPETLVLAERAGAARVVEGSGGALALAVRDGEVWAIDAATRRPRRFHIEGDTLVELAAPAPEAWPGDVWQFAAAGPGWVVSPMGTELVLGAFTGRGRPEVAVAFGRGEVAVLDARTGEPRFAARLEQEIAQLAAVDFDGDGVDELAIVAGRGLVILGTP